MELVWENNNNNKVLEHIWSRINYYYMFPLVLVIRKLWTLKYYE